ncbi:MAG TPA: RNA polymerase sigma factor [Cyclobacteriaceae bacterium]|nr:RNA polymerase sigma factor [Cyclobacteriaceae bacterium]
MKISNPDLDALSDNALMVKVRDGDIDKLGPLFERYKRPLYGFFYGMNRDAELSEDLVQNVFYRILRYRHVFRGDGDFKVWMFHIARNVNHDHFRKDKIRNKESVDHWQEKLKDETNRYTEFEHSEEMMILSAAMERLPEEKREILLLSKFHEKKYKEIGEILGCSEGAVKVKVFRALRELKETYQQLERKI